MKKQQQNKTRKTVNLNKVGMKEKGKKKQQIETETIMLKLNPNISIIISNITCNLKAEIVEMYKKAVFNY